MTSEMERTAIVAPNAPGGRSYSQAVGVGRLCLRCWHRGQNMETGTFPAGIATQMEQAIKNIGEVLAAADCRLDDVVKVTTYITPEAVRGGEEAVLAEEIYTRAILCRAEACAIVTEGGLPIPALPQHQVDSVSSTAVTPGS